MYQTALVVFREILEVAIIMGIIMAATRGVPSRNRWVWLGVAGGVAGSLVIAYFVDAISGALDGMGQEAFNGLILSLAAIMIGWTVVWMKKHGREIALKVKHVGVSVATGELPLYSVAVVIALAVWREGAEIVLFTYSILSAGNEPLAVVIAGGLAGGVTAAALGAMIYLGLIRLHSRYLFAVTGWMLVLLACGMSAQAAGFFGAAGFIPELMNPVWDSGWLLSQESVMGKILHAMLGYTEQPTGMQLVWYGTTFALLSVLLHQLGRVKQAASAIA